MEAWQGARTQEQHEAQRDQEVCPQERRAVHAAKDTHVWLEMSPLRRGLPRDRPWSRVLTGRGLSDRKSWKGQALGDGDSVPHTRRHLLHPRRLSVAQKSQHRRRGPQCWG